MVRSRVDWNLSLTVESEFLNTMAYDLSIIRKVKRLHIVGQSSPVTEPKPF